MAFGAFWANLFTGGQWDLLLQLQPIAVYCFHWSPPNTSDLIQILEKYFNTHGYWKVFDTTPKLIK